MLYSTAVYAVQFMLYSLCDFGAALEEKSSFVCVSYLLGSYLISYLSIWIFLPCQS